MNPKTLFRLLLIAMFLGGVAGPFVAEFPGNSSEDWRTITEWNGNGGFYDYFDTFTLPANVIARVGVIALLMLFVLFLVSVYVGLFLFWRFARLANLVLTIIFLFLAPWAGLLILLPIEVGLYEFTMICEGAVIAFSYSPPVKDYFESVKSA